jgi:hypothetical protein
MRYGMSMSSSMLGVLGAITLAAGGCGGSRLIDPGPGKRVEATLIQDAYLSRALVNITVKNLSDLTLTYPLNFCKIELQQEESSGWVTVLVPDGCPLALAFLGPRQTVTQEYRLPLGITTGNYRLSMPMPVPEGATVTEPRLITPPFRVGSTAF